VRTGGPEGASHFIATLPEVYQKLRDLFVKVPPPKARNLLPSLSCALPIAGGHYKL
jgi:hypothetical protein